MARGGGRVGFSNSSGSPSAVESLDATMSPAASLECPEYLQYLDSTPDAPFARAWAVEVRNVPALDADETDADAPLRKTGDQVADHGKDNPGIVACLFQGLMHFTLLKI